MHAPYPLIFRTSDRKLLLDLLKDLAAPSRRSPAAAPLSVQLDRLAAIRRTGRGGTSTS